MKICSVYTTHANEEEAKKFVQFLVESKWIACGNIIPMQSYYWWENEIEMESEYIAILKTRDSLWEELLNIMNKIHPYAIPCFIKYEVESNEAYKNWIYENTRNL